MQYKYKDKKLQKLAQGEVVKEYSSDTTLVRAFHKCINQIKAAKNLNDLKNIRALHYESYRERPECSVRLNKQWRLMVRMEGEEMVICAIENYH